MSRENAYDRAPRERKYTADMLILSVSAHAAVTASDAQSSDITGNANTDAQSAEQHIEKTEIVSAYTMCLFVLLNSAIILHLLAFEIVDL